MNTNQLTMFNSGDTFKEYRDRISAYFVKQENNHTVQKVQVQLNTLVNKYCPDYAKQKIQETINQIKINDCKDFNLKQIKDENSDNKIALALFQILASIVNDTDRQNIGQEIIDFSKKLLFLTLDDPKKTVSEYLFEPKIVLEARYNQQNRNFELHRCWEDTNELPFRFMDKDLVHRTSELSRDFARYICRDEDLEQVLGYMDCLITYIKNNDLDFNDMKQPLVMELENLFYLLDQAIRSEEPVTLEKVESIFTEADNNSNPSIVFKNSAQIIQKLKSLVNDNATKYMIAHQRDCLENQMPESF